MHPRHPIFLVYKPRNVDQLGRKTRKLVRKKIMQPRHPIYSLYERENLDRFRRKAKKEIGQKKIFR